MSFVPHGNSVLHLRQSTVNNDRDIRMDNRDQYTTDRMQQRSDQFLSPSDCNQRAIAIDD